MARNPRARRWVFTINNFTYEEQFLIENLETDIRTKYIIAEMEHLNEGTPHIQGYWHTNKLMYRTGVERSLGGRAFIEVAHGSETDNINYCSKEDQIFVQSIESSQTKIKGQIKSDIDAQVMLNEMRNLNEEEFEAAYPAFYMRHKALYRETRMEAQDTHTRWVPPFGFHPTLKRQQVWDGNLKSKNLWMWGPPGTGKSRSARLGIEQWRIYSKAFNKWWNGYSQETTKRIIIEDWPNALQGGNTLCQHLKIWGDRYPFTAELKGGHIAVEPSYQLIITSNYSIDDCFSSDEDKEAIKRRFSEIHLTNDKNTIDPYLVLDI